MRTGCVENAKIILLAGWVLVISWLLLPSNTWAQSGQTQAEITFGYRNNGKEIPDRTLKLLVKDGLVAFVSSRSDQSERQFLNFNSRETLQLLKTDAGIFVQRTPFSELEPVEILEVTDTILGYPCQKAKLSIRSNRIEVWFTQSLDIKASPRLNVGPDLGLVLKIVQNGSFEVFAQEIDFREISDAELDFEITHAEEVSAAMYRRKQIDGRFKMIPIFEHEQVNFEQHIPNPEPGLENKVYHYSTGSVVLKKVGLPQLKAGDRVFAELSSWSNGDAYDRTGSVFVVPVDQDTSFLDAFEKGIQELPVYSDAQGKKYQGVVATSAYAPPLEWMRFFTTFGVRQFNEEVQIAGYDWADSVIYRQDISELMTAADTHVWVGVFIGNYDKGGHILSLNLKYYPAFEAAGERLNWAKPIFNTLNVMEMSGQEYAIMFHDDSLRVTVNVPEGIENLRLRYTATGHGGWGGGDEFNQKLNEIFVDGKRVYAFIPWRTDCATYRLNNPSSGNFGNGLSSSDLSRSNWCPGTLTVPVDIPLRDLSPGPHTFTIAIPIGQPEGSSFSAWNVSGILIGEKSL